MLIALALCASPAAAQMTIEKPPDTTPALSTFRSADDGWFDVSSFLDEKYGFLPVAIPITEPAVGYGAAVGLMFISEPLGQAQAGFGRPDIMLVGGLGTENGTWGLLFADVRHWLGDRLQTQVGLTHLSANLDFHGIGQDRLLDRPPAAVQPRADRRGRAGQVPRGRYTPLGRARVRLRLDPHHLRQAQGDARLARLRRESRTRPA